MIPLFKVFMSPDVNDYLEPVLHSGYIGEGPKSKEFEGEFGRFIGNENVAVVSSGTMALMIALRLAGVRHGHMVASTPVTCLATNMAILAVGAHPSWIDVYEDGTVNPSTVDRRARAIVCMDWGGRPCKIDELRQLGIPVIEDACQSLGSYYKGAHVGSAADFTCFSFQAIKTLTTGGDGGAVAVRVPALADRARLIRWFGLDRSKGASMRCLQDPPMWGYKAQLNDVAASIGLANLRYLHRLLADHRRNAKIYDEAFGIQSDPSRVSGNWLYTIYVDSVPDFIRYMASNGVECSLVHERNDTKTVFNRYVKELPGVDWFDSHHVCIPVGWWVSEEDAHMIARLVRTYLDEYDSLAPTSTIRDLGERVALS